jgi:hypothetical protein
MRLDRLQVRRYMERPAGAAIAAGVRWLTFSCPAYEPDRWPAGQHLHGRPHRLSGWGQGNLRAQKSRSTRGGEGRDAAGDQFLKLGADFKNAGGFFEKPLLIESDCRVLDATPEFPHALRCGLTYRKDSVLER